jgi:hypothetical protein
MILQHNLEELIVIKGVPESAHEPPIKVGIVLVPSFVYEVEIS